MKMSSRTILSSGAAALLALTIALPTAAVAATAGEHAKPAAAHHEMHHKAKMMHHAKASPTVKAAQEALDKAGFKVKADGIMGRHTRMAIKAFQKKNGLKVTGRLDKATLAKLHAK